MYKMIKLEVGEDFYYSGQLWEIEDIKIKSEKQNSGIIRDHEGWRTSTI